MATLNENQAKLFTNRNWGVIATIREDGSPQSTPVWVDYDGENVIVNSAHGRTKVTNIERDPRATVTVLPAENQQSGYVMVSGPAELVDEGARASRPCRSSATTACRRWPARRRSCPRLRPERAPSMPASS